MSDSPELDQRHERAELADLYVAGRFGCRPPACAFHTEHLGVVMIGQADILIDVLERAQA